MKGFTNDQPDTDAKIFYVGEREEDRFLKIIEANVDEEKQELSIKLQFTFSLAIWDRGVSGKNNELNSTLTLRISSTKCTYQKFQQRVKRLLSDLKDRPIVVTDILAPDEVIETEGPFSDHFVDIGHPVCFLEGCI